MHVAVHAHEAAHRQEGREAGLVGERVPVVDRDREEDLAHVAGHEVHERGQARLIDGKTGGHVWADGGIRHPRQLDGDGIRHTVGMGLEQSGQTVDRFIEHQRPVAPGAHGVAGATDEELADHFKVCVRTIYRWRNTHEEFAEAVVVGKEHADARVERALYSRAVGCSVAAAMAVYYWLLFFPPRLVGSNDPDRYYHLGLAAITAEHGLPATLPQVEDLGWGNYFPDKEFLFHALTGARATGDVGMAAVPVAAATGAAALPANMLDMPIEELDLPMRAYNSLKRNNIVKVGQLLQLKDDDLLRMRNFGKKSLDEMKERLRMRGFIIPETESDGVEDGETDETFDDETEV